jgi:uncharacterized phage protein gp47/JayE
LKNQLKNVKAGQAMSLQMVNGELKLTSTQAGKTNGKEKENKTNLKLAPNQVT